LKYDVIFNVNAGRCNFNETIFSAVRADFGLPLPARRVTDDPVSSTRWQIVCNVLKLQAFYVRITI